MTTEILFWTFSGLLLLHYAGYPLALAVISILAPRRDAQSSQPARAIPVSVLISARNEERHIGARIENLLAQDYDGPVEILVGSDASTDRTDTIVSSFEGVILARSDARAGKPRMLQELRKKATGRCWSSRTPIPSSLPAPSPPWSARSPIRRSAAWTGSG